MRIVECDILNREVHLQTSNLKDSHVVLGSLIMDIFCQEE